MSLVTIIVRDSLGRSIRRVSCQELDIPQQLAPGETAALATETDLAAHRAAVAQMVEDAKAFHEHAEPTEAEIVLEALKSKLTPSELAAARVRLTPSKK